MRSDFPRKMTELELHRKSRKEFSEDFIKLTVPEPEKEQVLDFPWCGRLLNFMAERFMWKVIREKEAFLRF